LPDLPDVFPPSGWPPLQARLHPLRLLPQLRRLLLEEDESVSPATIERFPFCTLAPFVPNWNSDVPE
jgi:hypothetical protein